MTFPKDVDFTIRYDGLEPEEDNYMLQISYGTKEEVEELKQQLIINDEIVDRLKIAVGRYVGKSGYEYTSDVLWNILVGNKK